MLPALILCTPTAMDLHLDVFMCLRDHRAHLVLSSSGAISMSVSVLVSSSNSDVAVIARFLSAILASNSICSAASSAWYASRCAARPAAFACRASPRTCSASSRAPGFSAVCGSLRPIIKIDSSFGSAWLRPGAGSTPAVDVRANTHFYDSSHVCLSLHSLPFLSV